MLVGTQTRFSGVPYKASRPLVFCLAGAHMKPAALLILLLQILVACRPVFHNTNLFMADNASDAMADFFGKFFFINAHNDKEASKAFISQYIRKIWRDIRRFSTRQGMFAVGSTVNPSTARTAQVFIPELTPKQLERVRERKKQLAAEAAKTGAPVPSERTAPKPKPLPAIPPVS